MDKIRTIFIGTSEFGIYALQKLIQDKYFNMLAVITQPDKKIGRQQVLSYTPIKKQAKKFNISVLQPEKILNCKTEITKLNPELVVVASYGQIIPKEILNIPKYGCINIHASLLPKYRGASCIQAAILNGDKKTGITIMKMDEHLDTGPILNQVEIKINTIETLETLHYKLALLSAKILPLVLENYINGKIKLILQNSAHASYVKILKKSDGEINCQKSAVEIECMIRALNPWPGAWTLVKRMPWAKAQGQKHALSAGSKACPERKRRVKSNLILKILQVQHNPLVVNKYKQGQLFLDNNKLAIQCGKDSLVIEKLQLEGKRAMEASEFLKGHESIINYQLRIKLINL